MLGRFLGLARGVLRPSDQAAVTQLVQRSTDLAFRLDNYCLHFFNSVEVFLAEQREGRQVGLYAQQERILPATRSQPHWTEVEVTWDQAHDLSLIHIGRCRR